jgi:hypothetical protein
MYYEMGLILGLDWKVVVCVWEDFGGVNFFEVLVKDCNIIVIIWEVVEGLNGN